jgi:hypothetical protein
LSASGAGQQYWYTSPSGTGTPVFIGNNYVTPNISANTTYYAVKTFTNATMYGGPLTTSIGTGAYYPTYTPYDSLTVMQPCRLKTVMVDASVAGNRTIELRDKMNNVITSTVVNIPLGVSTVTLNFNLTPGFGYRLGLATASTAKLYRNSAGVTYPYNIGSLVSITGSSQGSGYFFFFYNWEVEPNSCTGPAAAVTATVNSPAAINVSIPSQLVCKDDSLVVITGNPPGGTFSGTGVSGNAFNPGVGQGSYNIYYTYPDANNCTANDSVMVVVGLCSGIKEVVNPNIFKIFPNPANDYFIIKTESADAFNLKITDASGKLIQNRQLNGVSNRINIDNLAKGIYFIEVQDAGSYIYRQKLIKQ